MVDFTSDDYTEQFNEYEKHQGYVDAPLPVCDECRCEIHDESYHEVRGIKICHKCLNKGLRWTEDFTGV